ncbi:MULTISPECIES: hypothetical protein [unclassified Bradyrhizobium]|jgi:hypothetical protein|uniref:hypothetical protein n=1 Tax=unclassified Bradyrhizobium TaxID=2631580 RepID=UPI000AE984D6|nr:MULTISPECIES: hypothetical protein [unclassified Bradyrhizobium]
MNGRIYKRLSREQGTQISANDEIPEKLADNVELTTVRRSFDGRFASPTAVWG